MNRGEEYFDEKHRQITCTGLALLITGGSLFYTPLTSSVKAESIQNVSNSLQTSTQRDRNSVKEAMRDTLKLGYPGYLLKILRVEKHGVMRLV